MTILALCLGGLFGCSPAAEDDAPSASAHEEAVEHEEVAVRVAVPVSLQGVVEELADSYAADKPWLSLEVQAFSSAKQENAAITPTTPDASDDEDTESEPADDEEPVLLPQADLVFQSSATAMDAAEELGAVDAATRSDMIEDSLAIVVSAQSKLSSVSLADIEAGSCRLAVVAGKSLHSKRQNEVLEAIGANLSALENGAQVEEATRDFLNWADTSEDALRIIEKWGLRYAA